MSMKLLVNCRDDFEAQMLEDVLKSANIPVHRQYRGFGDAAKIYTGLGQDVDLYVREQNLEEARQLLEAFRDGALDHEDQI
ncbi:MAG: DUF2007 domain-containing protein [Firmicutes bacterium]|nr:DUF2007 domain-containing protein [Bacillota bacterium]